MKSDKSITSHPVTTNELEAFEKLFKKHYAGLIRYCSQLVGSQDISREVIQDVFMQLWEKRQLSTDHPAIKAYLFRAVHNRALNHLRHKKIAQSYESEIWTEWLHAPKKIPEVNPFVKEALENAINSLPDRARKCFTYTQIDGLSYKETAELLGISDKTVDNQTNRARKLLRHKLRHYNN